MTYAVTVRGRIEAVGFQKVRARSEHEGFQHWEDRARENPRLFEWKSWWGGREIDLEDADPDECDVSGSPLLLYNLRVGGWVWCEAGLNVEAAGPEDARKVVELLLEKDEQQSRLGSSDFEWKSLESGRVYREIARNPTVHSVRRLLQRAKGTP